MPDYYDDDFATADGATNEAEDGGGAGGGVTVEASSRSESMKLSF